MTYHDELLTVFEPIDDQTAMVEIERRGRTYRVFYESLTDLAVMLFEAGFSSREIECVLSDVERITEALAESRPPRRWPLVVAACAAGLLLLAAMGRNF